MPTQQIHTVEMLHGKSLQEQVEYLTNEVAKLQKILRYLLNGQLDFENIRARGIKSDNIEAGSITVSELADNAVTEEKILSGAVSAVKIQDGAVTADKIRANAITSSKIEAGAVKADKIDVDELSAITADLGEVIAGIITGLLIRTSKPGIYPRVEFDSSNNAIRYYKDPNSTITLGWHDFVDLGITLSSSLAEGYLQVLGDTISLSGQADTKVGIYTTIADIELIPGFSNKVVFRNWSSIYSDNDSRTLQQALNAKADNSEINDLWNEIDDLNDDKISNGGPRVIDYINATSAGLVIWFKDGSNETILFD